ncbi:MAG: sulfatase-like hydrolase/transferase [Elusimicrobia bacterium]|nr:sulfatase-like hydrolase/transferase [Elusimicrobiota bacterium]
MTKQHLYDPGNLAFLFVDGGLRASGQLPTRRVLALLLVFSPLALLLEALRRRAATTARASLLTLAAAVAAAAALDLTWTRALVTEDPRYASAIASSALPWFRDLTLGSPVRAAIGAPARDVIGRDVPGMVPLRSLADSPGRLAPPGRAAAGPAPPRPQTLVFLILDGWRYDHFNAKDSPFLHAAARRGAALSRHYVSVAASDYGLYSLYYGRHPIAIPRDFATREDRSPFLEGLRAEGYSLHAFHTRDGAYRHLTTINKNFDSFRTQVRDGPPTPVEDGLMVGRAEELIRSAPAAQKHVISLFLHSTHFPFYGKRTGDPRENYAQAVRHLDALAKRLIDTLDASGRSYVVVATGDHAMGLMECGNLSTFGANEFTLHVPLVFLGSKGFEGFLARLRRPPYLTTHQQVPGLFVESAAMEAPLTTADASAIDIAFVNAPFLPGGLPLLRDAEGNQAVASFREGGFHLVYAGSGRCPARTEAPIPPRFLEDAAKALSRFQGLP